MPYVSGNYETPEQLGFFPGAGALVSTGVNVGRSLFGRKPKVQNPAGTYTSQNPGYNWAGFYNELPAQQKANYQKFVRKGGDKWGSTGDFAAWWFGAHTAAHPNQTTSWTKKLEKYKIEAQPAATPAPAAAPSPVRQAPPPPPAQPQQKEDGAWDAIGKIFEALGPAPQAPQQPAQIVTQATPQAPTVISVPGAPPSPAPGASAPQQAGLPPWALPVGAGALALLFLMRRN